METRKEIIIQPLEADVCSTDVCVRQLESTALSTTGTYPSYPAKLLAQHALPTALA